MLHCSDESDDICEGASDFGYPVPIHSTGLQGDMVSTTKTDVKEATTSSVTQTKQPNLTKKKTTKNSPGSSVTSKKSYAICESENDLNFGVESLCSSVTELGERVDIIHTEDPNEIIVDNQKTLFLHGECDLLRDYLLECMSIDSDIPVQSRPLRERLHSIKSQSESEFEFDHAREWRKAFLDSYSVISMNSTRSEPESETVSVSDCTVITNYEGNYVSKSGQEANNLSVDMDNSRTDSLTGLSVETLSTVIPAHKLKSQQAATESMVDQNNISMDNNNNSGSEPDRESEKKMLEMKNDRHSGSSDIAAQLTDFEDDAISLSAILSPEKQELQKLNEDLSSGDEYSLVSESEFYAAEKQEELRTQLEELELKYQKQSVENHEKFQDVDIISSNEFNEWNTNKWASPWQAKIETVPIIMSQVWG